MPFYRPLSETAPDYDRNLPWPIGGLAYVAAFMGPTSAGLFAGVVARDWATAVVGLLLGIGITLLNGLLMDRLLEPRIAKHQKHLLPWRGSGLCKHHRLCMGICVERACNARAFRAFW
jgi:hypothetical protein